MHAENFSHLQDKAGDPLGEVSHAAREEEPPKDCESPVDLETILLTTPPRWVERPAVGCVEGHPSTELGKVPRLPRKLATTSHECKAHNPPQSQEKSFLFPVVKTRGTNQGGI